MSVHSLRRRLLTGTLAWVLASIALAGWGLRELFVSHITEQLQEQLLVQLNQLSAAVDWNADGRVTVGPMAADANPMLLRLSLKPTNLVNYRRYPEFFA